MTDDTQAAQDPTMEIARADAERWHKGYPFASELYEGLCHLAERGGETVSGFEAPREYAAFRRARAAFEPLIGVVAHEPTNQTPVTDAYHDMDEAAHSWGSALLFVGIRIGLAFADYQRTLVDLFPERGCPDCLRRDTPTAACRTCCGKGWVPATFGP